MNSSIPGSGKLTVTKALTTDVKILPPGGEAMATEVQGKYENVTAVPSGGILTPGKETSSLGKHPVTKAPGAKHITSVDHLSVTTAGTVVAPVHIQTETPVKKSVTTVSPQPVTSRGMTVAIVHLQKTSRKMIVALRRKTMTLQKVTVPSRKMSVTPDEQNMTLQRENLTFEGED
jgi:hypothetical protein